MTPDHPTIIGVDGGATKVSAWVIDRSSNGFSLGNIHSHKIYSDFSPFDPGFTPVDIQIQLKEMVSNIHQTGEEHNQSQAVIAAFVEVISELYQNNPILLGIGMPGLKTGDSLGIAAMANGPRMPHFSNDLEKALKSIGIQLAAPIHRLGSDADYCGVGEEYAKDGLFKSVGNGYYLGGGTGAADALKLNNNLIPLDQTKSWLLKSWEMANHDHWTMERFASAGGIQSIYSQYSGISIDLLNRDAIYPNVILDRANQGKESALKTFGDVGQNLANLLFERIDTIFSGWNGRFGFANPSREVPASTHPYLGTVLDRIIVGQRLGILLESSKGMDIFWEPLMLRLENLIINSDGLSSKAKSIYLKNEKLNPSLIKISTLKDAPALGAGIDAAQVKDN